MIKLLGRSLGLLAALLLYGFTGTSQAQLVLYDDFTGPRINPTKWFAREISDSADAPNLETHRAINAGRLLLALTTYGGTEVDDAISGVGRQGLRISDPSRITTIQAEVTISSVTTQGCPANPNPTVSSVQIVGTFFNDGTVGEPDRTGDIFALLRKSRSSSAGNRIEAFVHRCNSEGCLTAASVVASHVFATTWTTGVPDTLRMEWDEANDLFRFTVNPGGAGEEVATIPYSFSDTTPLRGVDFKELRIQNSVADCTAGQKRATITGRFDDVMLNP